MNKKYLLKNLNTNVIELVFDLPVNPSPPLDVIEILEEQFRPDMLNSIFVNINNYKPYPAWGKTEDWWESDGVQWVDGRSEDRIWKTVRQRRDAELTASDWTQIIDVPLHDGVRTAWKKYRTQLRDVPNTYTNPHQAEKSLNTLIEQKPRN